MAKTKKTAAPKETIVKRAPAKKLTKADQLVKLMGRANGATVNEILKELPMQLHSLRGLISTVKKKRGLDVRYDRETERYRILRD